MIEIRSRETQGLVFLPVSFLLSHMFVLLMMRKTRRRGWEREGGREEERMGERRRRRRKRDTCRSVPVRI